MNLQQIETFVRVVEAGSFSKAAVLLDMAQPALSRQVRALEMQLRETLLIRTGRGVQPTDAGRRLLEHGHAILQRVALAKEDLGALRDEPYHRWLAAKHGAVPDATADRKLFPCHAQGPAGVGGGLFCEHCRVADHRAH